jgi:hypothetical protein
MLILTMQKTMTNGLTSFVCGFCGGGGYAPKILYAQAGGRLLRLFSEPRKRASHERPEYQGSADIIGLLPDRRFMAGEVKAPDDRLPPEQQQFLADIRDTGGFAVFVHSIKGLDEALRGAGYAVEDMALFSNGPAPGNCEAGY